ncbi:MAG TPA: NAD-dependent epimerase/dehydratase family protein [Mycobacterium sp.]|uniref:NAD-dependent epimerase/dehydratase family protein n=1 Tax=Mycobacterium sp. TaxID=1785 RepID=UPI002C082C95|nr:NAD-dependent epimerase/dehydratase family protein [Mycobacterium sp.]HME79621.1 NAD-dependent epimerase/dehydratase family protein [Mycobacterium sp.]
MKIVVTGASGVVGRGVASRLHNAGHDVVGLARRRPASWPLIMDFAEADIRDATAVRRAVVGAEVVVHCAWAASSDVNVGGTANLLEAMAISGSRRIVFVSSAQVYGTRPNGTAPLIEDGVMAPAVEQLHGCDKATAEAMIANAGVEWVTVRSALVLGREVENAVLRLLAAPMLLDVVGSGDQLLQVVHTDDIHRLLVRAVLDDDVESRTVNLAAAGVVTLKELAAAIGRPLVRVRQGMLRRALSVLPGSSQLPISSTEYVLPLNLPLMDTTRLQHAWGFDPVWSAQECAADFGLAVRGRVSFGGRTISLPWRVGRVESIPAVEGASVDGVVPVPAGPEGGNCEFDTPIDPRFPTFVATNLAEALRGPFSPSSASVTVRGVRAGAVRIAATLRPGGVVQREMALRTVGVFAHRLYGGVTSVHFMAETVPFASPSTILGQFFGPTIAAIPLFGAERPPRESRSATGQLRDILMYGAKFVGISAGSMRDTRDFVADIERLEQSVGQDFTDMNDERLLSQIVLARDHIVHGWTLASASILLCTAYGFFLRRLTGHDITPMAGPDLVSAHPLDAVRRLVALAQRDPDATTLLSEPGEHVDALREQVPEFYAAFAAELASIGHRGPAEAEMRSSTYADNPELFLRMVAKSLGTPAPLTPRSPMIPILVRPIAMLAAWQLRDREVRRDKVIRAIWVLRLMLREYGRRLTGTGVFETADDVFYLLVDELNSLPPNVSDVVARRRAEQNSLAAVLPPPAFSGSWRPADTTVTVLTVGETMYGRGICGGRVRGRVRIVRPETIDDLQSGEILVAEVTDVGYTPAFAYAAAVVTDLGGPMSHAAVVAREFGVPCVVNANGASRRLPEGSVVEVDGATGEIRVIELGPHHRPASTATGSSGVSPTSRAVGSPEGDGPAIAT